jgi:hypothetical protein
VWSGTTSYQHTGAVPGSTYYYLAYAFTDSDRTDYSNVASSQVSSAPSAPSALNAQDSSPGNLVELTWQDNSSNETGFSIERSEDGTNFVMIESVEANATSASDTTPQRDRYFYRVRAYNGINSSSYSNIANATSPAPNSTHIGRRRTGDVHACGGGQAGEGVVATQSVLTARGAVMGTVPYMSPEQLRSEPLDARSDLFSFGVMLYEMVSGQPPFTAANSASLMSAILTEDPQPLARYARDTPPELERIVSKAMRKDRDSRYQTAKDLLIDLRTLQDEVRTGAARARSPSSSPSAATSGSPVQTAVSTAAAHAETVAAAPPSRFSLRTPLIAIALLAVVGAGVWFYRHRTNVAWATAQVPRIDALAQSRDFFQAYDLALAARKYLPSDPTVTRLMPTLADTLSVTTSPASAQVYLKRFAPDASGALPPRELIGATPIKNLQIARGE